MDDWDSDSGQWDDDLTAWDSSCVEWNLRSEDASEWTNVGECE